MADTPLRELERRFRETGNPADEAAWLTERMRIGELDHLRVAVAAGLGHEAALMLVPRDAPTQQGPWARLLATQFGGRHPLQHLKDPAELVSTVASLGGEALQRLACAGYAGSIASFRPSPVRDYLLEVLALGERTIEAGAPLADLEERDVHGELDRAAREEAASGGNPTGTQDIVDMYTPTEWIANRSLTFIRAVSHPKLPGVEHDVDELCGIDHAGVRQIHGGAAVALKTAFVPWLLGTREAE